MGALALGIVLIVGYFYQNNHPYRRLELIRSTGYHIYFKAGLSGFIFLTLAIVFWILIDFFDLPSALIDSYNLKDSLSYIKNNSHWNEIKMVAVFALMFLLSATSVITRKLLNNKEGSLKRVKIIAHELELLIINATTSVSPLRIELDCGKVYIGIPETPNLEQGEVKYITLLPLLSGYIDDTKKIIFNNNYYRHYEENFSEQNIEATESHSSMKDFSIVIPVEQVVVASRFSIDAFIEFRKDTQSQLIGSPRPVENKCS
jgi:hypothetical protein